MIRLKAELAQKCSYGGGTNIATGLPIRERRNSPRPSHISVQVWQDGGKAYQRRQEELLASSRVALRSSIKALSDQFPNINFDDKSKKGAAARDTSKSTVIANSSQDSSNQRSAILNLLCDSSNQVATANSSSDSSNQVDIKNSSQDSSNQKDAFAKFVLNLLDYSSNPVAIEVCSESP